MILDTHVHLLPGLDDGPEDAAGAEALARLMAAESVEGAVATPHCNHPQWPTLTPESVFERFQQTKGLLERFFPVFLGAEVWVDWQFLQSLQQVGFPWPTLAGSRYVLLEFPGISVGPEPAQVVHELRLAGYRPVLAHAERLGSFHDAAVLHRILEAGGLLQINAASILGEHGRQVQRLVRRWIAAGLVFVVASDAHHVARRPPALAAVFAALQREFGEALARLLLWENPRRILEDEPPGEAPGTTMEVS
jgi:protein-tyrosine phosphatase